MYVILGTYVVGLIPATSPPERDDEKNCPPSTHSRNVLRFTDLWNAIKNYRWQHRHQQPPPHHDAQIAESSLKSTLNWVLQKIMRTTYFFRHYAAAHFTLWGKHKNCPISLNCQWSNNELWCLLIFDWILAQFLILFIPSWRHSWKEWRRRRGLTQYRADGWIHHFNCVENCINKLVYVIIVVVLPTHIEAHTHHLNLHWVCWEIKFGFSNFPIQSYKT